jgi:hypothetical protein
MLLMLLLLLPLLLRLLLLSAIVAHGRSLVTDQADKYFVTIEPGVDAASTNGLWWPWLLCMLRSTMVTTAQISSAQVRPDHSFVTGLWPGWRSL